MKKVYVFIPLLILISILIAGTFACRSGSSSNIDEAAVLAYADPATETTLQGLSEKDITKYTQYGDAQFKAGVTQEVFDKVASQIENQLGTYVSKEFSRIEEVQGYTVVHYKAKYTKGTIGVRVAFDKEHLVAGQYFE
jgi:hypothetical protein